MNAKQNCKIVTHTFTGADASNYWKTLGRTEMDCAGERLIFVRFDAGRVEVYRVDDGLEIHVGYLSREADARFDVQLREWQKNANCTRNGGGHGHISTYRAFVVAS